MKGPEGARSQANFSGNERRQGEIPPGVEGKSEIYYVGPIEVKTRMENGVPVDVAHLYQEFYMPGQSNEVRWWIERESIANKRVREAHKQEDWRYKDVPEDSIPSTVTHSTRPSRGTEYIWVSYIPGTTISAEAPQNKTQERSFSHQRHMEQQAYARPAGQKQSPGSGEQRGQPTYRIFEEPQEAPYAQDTPRTAPQLITERKSAVKAQEPEQDAELQQLEEQLRARLQKERERRGEDFNAAEYVRTMLTDALKDTTEERYKKLQSLVTAFDAIAYDRYTSDVVKQEALDRLEKRYVVEDKWISNIHLVSQAESTYLKVISGALGILYKSDRWNISPSSTVVRDLNERHGGVLEKMVMSRPIGTNKKG